MLTITTPTIEFENRGLMHIQLQQVLDYIHTHLDRDLSLTELAEAIDISPTYFASLFKQAMAAACLKFLQTQLLQDSSS